MNIDETTYLINGCAMKVHRHLGPGFQEVIYQRALEIELGRSNVDFIREGEQNIYYLGKEIGTRRVDFTVNDAVVVEIKAVTQLLPVHIAQAKNYITVYEKPIGLLLNFGSQSLEIRKLYPYNSRYTKQ